MKKRVQFGDILTGIYGVIIIAYSALLLVNSLSALIKLINLYSDHEILTLAVNGVNQLLIWMAVIIAVGYTIGLVATAVIGVLKYKTALTVLLVLLAILEVGVLFLIGGMDFTTGTIMHGFDTILVIPSETGWAIYANFYVIFIVLAATMAYSNKKYGN